MARSVTIGLAPLAIATALFLSATANATTYRWTDPRTGRSVLSDQPPPPGVATEGKRTPVAGSTTAADNLPYAVRQAHGRFPVTVYLTPDCEPCDQGRKLLTARGIPFTQIDATAPDAQQTLKTLTGKGSIPLLLVGQQSADGFEAGTWNRLLDLAGYPATAAPGYRAPPPLPKASVVPIKADDTP